MRGENQEQQSHRDGDAVIERRADRDLVALDKFGNLREPRAPENGEAEQHEEQVVEEETGFAGDQRFELVLAAQVLLFFTIEETQIRRR